MLTYKTQLSIDNAIHDFVGRKVMFTAQEIVDQIKANTSVTASYDSLRDAVHAFFFSGKMGLGYARRSSTFDNKNGEGVNAYVYHPKWSDPKDYVSHEVRVKNSPCVASVTACAPAPTCTVTGGFYPANPPKEKFPGYAASKNVVVVDPSKKTAETDSTVVVPLTRKPLPIEEAEILYSVDAKGRMVLGPDLVGKITNIYCPTTVLGLRERKRLVLAVDDGATPGNAVMLRTDYKGNLRIPFDVIHSTGIVGHALQIVVEDGAIYITQAK